ncbi:aspartate/glutamate racemase family protein [Pseudorhodobacter sp.]|uniref:aspartate/glutamate racemase family protein n=1 Tax=Pseudorhodobacter sp. TaxID=1934400 RepID=UPI0026477EA3|nr:aspartate/glutamate racemase family protein [Pseudorhodobacter sp.]MDN5786789.1 aspartate/glutamate racemase family protein [Pseudorhodobacter sp.]
MRIMVINPNSTASMTAQIRTSAEACAFVGTVIEAANPIGTPRSIEGYSDEARSVPAMLDLIEDGQARGAQGFVIACFDDPGLAAAREVARGPVVGICQAAVQVATTICNRFSIVTTLPRSVPIIEDLVAAYGASSRCQSVRAVDMPVLALEAEPVIAEARLLREIEAARDIDGAEVVILGCAGMSELCERLALKSGMPVIDGVVAAVKLIEGLIGGGYATSKRGSYNFPRDKGKDEDSLHCPAITA